MRNIKIKTSVLYLLKIRGLFLLSFLFSIIVCFLSLNLILKDNTLYAALDEDQTSYESNSSSKNTQKSATLSSAIGLGVQWLLKREYGELDHKKTIPEFSIINYLKLSDSFYLRNTFELGYSWKQPQMPKGLSITEKDLLLFTSLGLVYDWYMSFDLSTGFGYLKRTTKLSYKEPISSDSDPISGTEWIKACYIHAGLVAPIFKNIVVIEPYVRFWFVDNDPRIKFSFGAEFSYYLIKRW